MTLTRKLASALCLAFSFITLSSNAQVDSTTGNLINFTGTPTATTSNWVNGVYVNQICFQAGQPGNCGPYPSIRASSGNINFSYGNVDLHQIVNINAALATGGNGVQLSGFNYSFTAKNGNGWDNGQQDYLAAYVKLYNSAGQLAANYDYTSQTNRRYNWTNFSFNETFATPQLASQYSTAQVGFVGRDTNFWAGNYGPEIMNVSFALKYRVDPCALNPAYSPNCSGFSNVVTSGNLINPDLMSNGNTVYNAFAISTALKSSGSGVDVYGFNYGYNYSLGNGTFGCTATNQDGSCSWWMTTNPNATMRAILTDSNNKVIYSATQSRSTPNTAENVSYQYLLPSTTNSLSLGNFTLGASTSGNAAIQNMYANVLYKPDPCVANPLYSTTCPGYATAYAKNMILGSTVASASGPVSSSTGNSMTSNTGTIDQSQGNTQPEQQQQTQQQGQQTQQSSPSPSTSPQQDASQNPSVAQDNPAQPSPTQQGPASTTPQPAGGPPQATQTASASSSSGPGGGGSAGPSKLAMSVVKTAQANDKATQNAAVQNAAKTLENATQSSQASSNLAISMNQDMSANSATAAANFASQTTQASVQVATQTSQGPQQTVQSSTQSQQTSRQGPQVQQQQQDTQQASVQSTSIVQVQPPQQQETQQSQVQTSTSVVKLLSPQQEDTQQIQPQSSIVVQYQPPKQQESQQSQSQTSTSVVRLMPPQQQEQQQTQSQMTAGMMQMPQTTYTPPVQQQQDTQSTQVSILKPPTPAVVEVQQQSSGTGITVSRNMFSYNPLMSSNTSNMSAPLPTPQPVYQPRLDIRQSEVDIPQFQIASFGGSRAGNPLSEIMMQQQFEMMQNNIAQPGSSVNRNVLPNEIAGGVDIASMATIPTGFNAYSFVLKDAAFYEPKEVYKNQRTVDNERVLRGLTRGSDAKHQEMIDQQYKLGN